MKRIKTYIINVFKRLILKDRSPRMLALSFCVGVYIAFSPYLFMHTAMVFVFAWVFSLHLPAVFAAAYLVNNPWTLVPIYTSDYFVGEFLLRTVCGFDTLQLNPAWMTFINKPIAHYTGISGISFWSFMLGGNLLGLLAGVMLYPVLKRIFATMSTRVYGLAKKSVELNHENCCTKQKSISRLPYSRPNRSGHCTHR